MALRIKVKGAMFRRAGDFIGDLLKKAFVPLTACGATFGAIVLWKDYIGGVWYEGKEMLYGRTVVITGANGGIGKEVTKNLADRGARIIMACVDMEDCQKVREEVVKYSCNKNIECKKLDLSSLNSVRQFAEDINKNEKRLDTLINNGGVMGIPDRKTTEDNFEAHLGVNYLGHYLLTRLLLDKLKENAPSRIVNVGCLDYRDIEVNFDDLNCDRDYKWEQAYGQSKRALMHFTEELDKRLVGTEVQALCAFPGLAYTRIHRYLGWYTSWDGYIVTPLYWLLMRSPINAAQSIIHCAVSPKAVDKTSDSFSLFITDCAKSTNLCNYESDETLRKRLWLTGEVWTGITKSEAKGAS